MALDNAALGPLNGLPVGYSDLTDDWMISGKLKIRDFLIGVQVWQAKEGAASASTKLAQPGALNGNVWSPQQASVYARYSTALQGNLNLTYLGQAKVHQLQPDSSAFLFRSYIGGPLGFVNLAADGGPSPAFWAQTRLAQSSNQFRNEVDLVYRPRRSFSLVGGVDLRYASIQKDYSKSSNCNEEEDVFDVPDDRLDQLLTLSPFNPSLADISHRAAARGAPFVAFTEGDRTNCIPTSGELKAPAAPGEHTAMREIGVFGQASYRPASNVKLVAGWRIDNGDVNLSKGYGTVATPRLAAVFSPRGIVLKAIYAEAFKDPANLERFSIIPGIRGVAADEDLRPERVRNLELSAGRQSSTYAANVSMYRARYSDVVGVSERNLYDELNTQEMGKFSDRMTERWYYTPDTWLESFQNALRQVPAGARSDVAKKFLNNPLSTLKFDNVATLDVWGVQSDGSWRKDRIELFGNYTFTHPVVVGAATGRSRVADIAKQRGMVGIAGGRGKVDASLRFHLVGPRPTASAPPVGAGPIGYIQSQPQRRLLVQPVTISELTSVGSRRGETIPGHVVGYLSGSYALSTAFTVQVTVDNLFDTSYSDPGIQTADDLLFAAQVPQPGRSAFVRVIARF
jgi:outer membrane receptor protein involved in Fe transport